MQFAAAVGLFAYLGLLLDRWLSTLPVFLVAGVLLGFGLGLVALLARVPPTQGREPKDPTKSSNP